MKKHYIHITAIAAFLMVLASYSTVFALQPSAQFYVNDYTGTMSQKNAEEMVSRGKLLCDQNGVQVVAVIVNNYVGADIESYANKIFNDFKIGQAADDNGVLLLLAIDDREVRIEVGDGLSGMIPDSKAGALIDEYFIPKAATGDFDGAVYDTYVQLITLASKLDTAGNPGLYQNNVSQANPAGGAVSQNNGISLFTKILIFLFILLLIGWINGKRQQKRNRKSGWEPYDDPHTSSLDDQQYDRRERELQKKRRSGTFWGGMLWGGPYAGGGHSSGKKNTSSGGGIFGSGSKGGGGSSSGGGASRTFSSGSSHKSGGSSSFGGGHSFGGGGHSSGGGSSRKF